MKKIVFLSLFACCLPLAMMAQSNDDDLYFTPSKDQEMKTPVKKAPEKRKTTTTVYTSPGTAVVVQDRKGKIRDVDEYNRRYDARDNDFEMEDDTLYVREKSQRDLDGEWSNGEFNGSESDYEYAERIIRFRNPRYAISVSSPLYWDVVYGMNSWDWNVYSDGLYAYAFPTFSNRLWWDWRFNSYGGGWGFGFGSLYCGWGGYPSYYGGWYGGGWYGGGWGHHHHYNNYYPGWGGGGGNYWASNRTYTNRRSTGVYDGGTRRSSSTSNRGDIARRSNSGRVVGTRSSDNARSSSERYTNTRGQSDRRESLNGSRDASTYSRSSTYTRPSSTRRSSDYVRGESTRSNSTSTRSYSRGSSSDAPVRSSSGESRSRSSYNSGNSSSSSRSYSPSSSSSSSRSSGLSSGGGSSRSSGGGGGGSSRSRR